MEIFELDAEIFLNLLNLKSSKCPSQLFPLYLNTYVIRRTEKIKYIIMAVDP